MNRNWPPGGEGGGGRRRKGMAAKEEEPEGGGANRASTNRNQPMTRCGNIEKDKQTNKQINKHQIHFPIEFVGINTSFEIINRNY